MHAYIPCIITTNDLPKSCRQCLCIVLRMDLPEYAYLLYTTLAYRRGHSQQVVERGASTVRLKLLWGRRCLHKAPRRTVTAPELIVVLTGYISTSSESCHRGKRPHLVVPQGQGQAKGMMFASMPPTYSWSKPTAKVSTFNTSSPLT